MRENAEYVTDIKTVRSSRYLDEGKRLFQQITKHKDDGNTVFAFGLLGSGKTTLIRQMMFAITCLNPKTKKYEKETAIWRGREHDDWISFPQNSTVLHIHRNDMDENYGRRTIFQRDDTNTELELSELPPIRLYSDAEELYRHIVHKKINIVYEPQAGNIYGIYNNETLNSTVLQTESTGIPATYVIGAIVLFGSIGILYLMFKRANKFVRVR